nr:hypothetical protein [uncultured Methanobrevibacter sp.]
MIKRELYLSKINKSRRPILENIVFLELIRRKYQVTVGNIGKQKILYVGNIIKLFISKYLSQLDENTCEREFNPLEKNI